MATGGGAPTTKAAARNAKRRARLREAAAAAEAAERDPEGQHVRAERPEATGRKRARRAATEEAADGAFGSYGSTAGPLGGLRHDVEDDNWATAQKTWDAVAEVLLPRLAGKKVWAPFYYEGSAGERLRKAGFARVVHKEADFFERIRDGPFVRSVDAVVDNPPYTGPGIKEKVLAALEESGLPFCLLLPLATLHSQMVRQTLDPSHVQTIVPRKVWVHKSGRAEDVPFKYLCWLCYKLDLERDLYLI